MRHRIRTALAVAAVLLGAVLAYSNSFRGAFLLDDEHAIVLNERIRHLWPIRPILSGSRPLVDLTFAINHALGRLDVRGYHVFNLAVHLAAAATLFALLRRTLESPGLTARYAIAATPLAAAAALLWAVHPLQTQAVTYVVQRAESMAALCCLLSLYCALRSIECAGTELHRRSKLWSVLSVLCCAMGMASKPTAVTIPLLVLLYDRTFLGGSFRAALRRSSGLYAGLAATWLLLALIVARQPPDPSAGFGMKGASFLQYLATQPGVILHYLRLAILPAPLCLDHYWPLASSVEEILLPAVAVALLAALCVWAMWRSWAIGYPLAWFFLVLAPTSSIMPLADACAEHRMYLPLAAVVALAVVGVYEAIRRRPTLLAAGAVSYGIVVAAFGYMTFLRNELYRDPIAMWQDVVRKRPTNPRARANLANELVKAGLHAEALQHYLEMTRLAPQYAQGRANLGRLLAAAGRYGEALEHYTVALEMMPGSPLILMNIAWLRATAWDGAFRDGREAIRLAREACQKTGGMGYRPLDVLAAAHAEAGEYALAAEFAEKALAAAREAGEPDKAAEIEERLQLYRTGKPFRERPSLRGSF